MNIMDNLTHGGDPKQKPIICIYGRPGIGKTTLASKAPGVIVLETERGLTNPDLKNVQTFGLLHKMEEFGAALKAVEEHHKAQKWQTLVIDSIDRLNPLIEQHVCRVNGWKSLEEGAYGKGKNLFREEWQKVLTKLIQIRDEHGLGIIMLGHHMNARVTPPDGDAYTQYTLNLDEKVRSLVIADCDIVAFATYPTHTIVRDEGFGKKQTRAITEAPILALQESGAFVAKNRYDMPAKISLDWNELAQYVPCYAKSKK